MRIAALENVPRDQEISRQKLGSTKIHAYIEMVLIGLAIVRPFFSLSVILIMQAYRWLTFLVVGLLVCIGCEESGQDPQRTTASVEDRLLFLSLVNARSRTPIADGPAFRRAAEALAKSEPTVLERLRLTSVDEAFTSPRDGQAFGLRFNVKPGTPGMDENVVAFESTSEGGQRFVAFSSAHVVAVDETKFQELIKE